MGPKPHGNESDDGPNETLDKKRLRNRLAQRTFRRRQAETRRKQKLGIDPSDKPSHEIIRALQEENAGLRHSLIDVQSKLARLIATMQGLETAVLKDLGECAPEKPPEGFDEDPTPLLPGKQEHADSKAAQNVLVDPGTSPHLEIPSPHRPQTAAIVPYPGDYSIPSTGMPSVIPDAVDIPTDFDIFAGQIPNIWSFEYQMGNERYVDALAAKAGSPDAANWRWLESNSTLSDHISALQTIMRRKLVLTEPISGFTMNLFYQKVLMAVSLFNSLVRPNVMRWYAKTRFYHIVDLTAWQIYPCARTLRAILPEYMPTLLQSQCQYPKVIDWIPFSSLRDGLIRLHSANPQIDQIFTDAVSSYVVQAWMSDLVKGAPQLKAYIRVTDIILPLMDQEPPANEGHTPYEHGVRLPAPDTATLFSSPAYSRAAFDFLSIDHGVTNYKIDPAFFAKYPELYDSTSDIIAGGIPLRPDLQIRLTHPLKRLDVQTFRTYQSFIDFSHDYEMLSAKI